MAKIRRYVEYLDGEVRGVVVTAGDEERARRNGLKRTDEGYQLQVLWYAAKRNELPHTGSEGDEPMLDWLDQVARYDMYLTQAEADEQIAALPPEPPAEWKQDLDTLLGAPEGSDERQVGYKRLLDYLHAHSLRASRAGVIQGLVRDDLGEA